MIRLAIQAKGRLSEESTQLLQECGLSIDQSKRKLLAKCEDFPLEIIYLRDDDIPGAVSTGVADVGIVGMNEVVERGYNLDVIHKLGFGKCRISLALPKGEEYAGIEWFSSKRVATSYPVILAKYFKENQIDAEIHQIAGSVEVAPSVGMADAIFDIVSSGGTLISNGLKEVERVFFSEAVFVSRLDLTPEKDLIVKQLLSRFQSVERSRGMKYLLMNLPQNMVDQVSALLPGMRSPTILPLAQKGWCSMHVVVKEREIWPKLEILKSLGAEGILVLSLEKMML
ncbi:MAG: ATP phosphoribosyltransferase [Bacteroidales bacterium]|jgi:ATP phosphoribosyltransferase|nr:ATP phosphoribosyltransferase [Bacteroidales bacterium]MDD3272953.1 ATP phosphoribosyltransferase [Bacteroidales bacterium]